MFAIIRGMEPSRKIEGNTAVLPYGRSRFLTICAILGGLFLVFSWVFPAFAGPFQPGTTLDPGCGPTSSTCTVYPPLWATTTLSIGGLLFVNDASGTITANTSILYVSSTNGYVGIGTSSPAMLLDVNGSTTLRSGFYLPALGSSGGLSLGANGLVTTSSFLTADAVTTSSAVTTNYYSFWGAANQLAGTSSVEAMGGGGNTSTAILGNLYVGAQATSSYGLYVSRTSYYSQTSSFAGYVAIGTTTPSYLLQVAGTAALGISSSTAGKLIFYNASTSYTATLQAAYNQTGNVTLTLPTTNGTSGYALITDGSGNLSWAATGFLVIASSTSYKQLTTSNVSTTAASITPSSANANVWITADLMASTTATSTVITSIYSSSTCGGTAVGNSVTVTIRNATGTGATNVPGIFSIAMNVVNAPATTTTQTYYVCVKNGTGATSSITFSEITLEEVRAGSDIAETYYAASSTPLSPGDVVSPDPSIDAGVKQSQSAYDPALLGVISTNPGSVLGGGPVTGVPELVALAGRVPVTVTNDNGDINTGDELTSSDIPGVAMRATQPGRVLGVALQSFAPDPGGGTATGTILVFVNPHWSLGNLTSTAEIASSSWAIGGGASGGQLVLDQFTAYVQAAIAKLGVAIANGVATLKEVIVDKIVTNELCIQNVCVTQDQMGALLKSIAGTVTSNQDQGSGGTAVLSSAPASASSSATSSGDTAIASSSSTQESPPPADNSASSSSSSSLDASGADTSDTSGTNDTSGASSASGTNADTMNTSNSTSAAIGVSNADGGSAGTGSTDTGTGTAPATSTGN